MNITDRVKKISQYFVDMRITTVEGEQVIYVVVNFPRNWVVDENIEKTYPINVWESEDYENGYVFCTAIENGEEVLFDAIDYSIEKMKSAIERTSLFLKKENELKELFDNENISLAQLKTLKFTYDATNAEDVELIVPGSRSGRRGNRDNKEVTEQNNEEK
jgi:hypothetical protein